MNAYKPTLDDIIKIRKDLSTEIKVNTTILSGVTKSDSVISKNNSSVKRTAEQNIVGLLGHFLKMDRLFIRVIDEKRKYTQATVKLIQVVKNFECDSHYVLYERVFFKGDKPKETFTFNKMLPLSNFKSESEEGIISLLKSQRNIIELEMGSPLLRIGSKAIHSNKTYHLISLNETKLEFKISPCDQSGIYLDYHYSNEEIDGIFKKDDEFAIHQMLQGNQKFEDEVEMLKVPNDNYMSDKLLVSVKGNADFKEALEQIIKHRNHLMWLDEFLLERKIPFLLICHSDLDGDDDKRRNNFRFYYKRHKKDMTGISLTVIYLKTQMFFDINYILSYDSLKDAQKDEQKSRDSENDKRFKDMEKGLKAVAENVEVKIVEAEESITKTVRKQVNKAEERITENVDVKIVEAEERITKTVRKQVNKAEERITKTVTETVKKEVSQQLEMFFKRLEKRGLFRTEAKVEVAEDNKRDFISKKRNREKPDDDEFDDGECDDEYDDE